MNWYITKKTLVLLIGILVAIIFWLALTSCIPVTVRPEFDQQGLPKALPVTPVGSIAADGSLVPVYPTSNESPQPARFPWGTIAQVALAVLGVGGGGYGLLVGRVANKAKTALRIACNLAEANAQAETDEQVLVNKQAAARLQDEAGVRLLTQKVRGK